MKKYSNKKAGWLTEIAADREEWLEFLGSTVIDQTLKEVGISRETWISIQADQCPKVSTASHRLASFRRHGHLEDIMGRPWRDFFTAGDALRVPGMKYPLPARDLCGLWHDVQQLPLLRRQVDQLRIEADSVDVSPAVKAWLYRLGKRPLVFN